MFPHELVWDTNSFWNASLPRLPRYFQDTVINGVPIIPMFISIVFIFNEPAKYINSHGIGGKAKLSSCLAVIIGYLAWMAHSFGEYFQEASLILPEALLFGLIAIKLILYITLSWLIHQRRVKKIDGFLWTASLLELIYLIMRGYHDYFDSKLTSSIDLAIFSLQLVSSFMVFLLFNIDDVDYDTANKSGLKSKDQTSFSSRLFATWLVGLFAYGNRNSLELEDLPALPEEMTSSCLGPKFGEHCSRQRLHKKAERQVIKSERVLLKLFWKELALAFVLSLIQEALIASIPILTKMFMQFMNSGPNAPDWHGYIIGSAMTLCTILACLLSFHSYALLWRTRVKMESSLNCAIYGKVLGMKNTTWQQFTVGKVLNLMSIDVTSFGRMFQFMNQSWTMPIRLCILTAVLYWTCGNATFFGLGAWSIVLVVKVYGSNVVRRLTSSRLIVTDKRVKLINEVLNGIKSVKMFAWEECLMDKIRYIRHKEVRILRKITHVESFISSSWSIGPMACVLSILGYQLAFDSERISAESMFLLLPIVDLLLRPINYFTEVHQGILLAFLSIERINSFLNLEEPEEYLLKDPDMKGVKMSDASLSWKKIERRETEDRKEEMVPISPNFKLEMINLNAANGQFICLIGQVGSGKTSLLNGILGEMYLTHGEVKVPGGATFALISQEPWIQNMSLRDNIVFGKPFNEEWYRKVVTACDLWPDIAILPHGDETMIGENGINLSGGQKQRINIARAVYHDCDIYILDDCLSALDAHVSKHIYERVLSSKTGLLKMKTRIMATNRVDIVAEIDEIFALDNGSIKWSGDFDQFLESDILPGMKDVNFSSMDHFDSEAFSGISLSEVTSGSENAEKEGIKQGSVSGKVYRFLWRRSPKHLVLILTICLAICVTGSIYSRILLVDWSKDSKTRYEYYIFRYAIGTLCEGISLYISMFMLGEIFIEACSELYLNSQLAILYCPLRYFDITPTGRILNRFSQDLNGLDTLARAYLRKFGFWTLLVVPAVLGSMIQLPQTSLVMIIIGTILVFFWSFFMPAYRQLKRHESVSRSPIYSRFRETISGLTSIRAFQAGERFSREFHRILDIHANTDYLFSLALAWRELISGLIPAFLYLAITIFAVTKRAQLSATTIGLLLSYAVKIAENLKGAVSFFGEFEIQLVAAERLLEYCELPSEGERFKKPDNLPDAWPRHGNLDFRNYSARYNKTANKVLNDVCFSVGNGEKIGIVGRTGAGKSSLTLAIYRMIENISGSIVIDGINISNVGLFHLRSNLTIIPQDPVIFSGTVRFNLDPFEKYKDSEIWRCLELTQLRGYFERFGQGLNYEIEESGKNLSTGQKQLMCLARSMLKKSKLILLDEATGSIDMETDFFIQKTLREEFKECTMLIVAHRLNTIIDCDRVMVLDAGTVVEFDSPANLLKDKTSRFTKLAKEAQISVDK